MRIIAFLTILYPDEKFYWTYQRSVHWPNDYIGPDSMTHWVIEKSQGFTDVGLLRISESVRAYAYLILSSQASARSSIVGNSASSLTAQSAFLNNFENVVNRKVDIQEDVKRYQETLSYALSKVDYSVGENLFMLPSDMELRIRSGTVGYNNKILVSDGKFNLGKNDEVNSLEAPAIKSHKTNSSEIPAIESHSNTAQGLTHASAISHGHEAPEPSAHEDEKPKITHSDEKIRYWLCQVVLQYGIHSDEISINVYYFCEDFKSFYCMGHPLS